MPKRLALRHGVRQGSEGDLAIPIVFVKHINASQAGFQLVKPTLRGF